MISVTVAAYFSTAALLGLAGRKLGPTLVPLAALPFVVQFGFALSSLGTEPIDESYQWLPSLDMTVAFRATSLTVAIAALVAGVGLLIVAYAGRYFANAADRVRFLALLSLFAGGMSGIVLSDDLSGCSSSGRSPRWLPSF